MCKVMKECVSLQSVADREVFLPNDEIWLYDLQSGLWCVCVVCVVCVCVVQVYPTLWGQNVPTTMAISKILVRVGTFFGPHEETSL